MPRFFRRCITIRATDSPNVQLGLLQRRAGQQPDHRELVAGVLTLAEYDHRLATWDAIRIAIGLDAEFYRGAVLLLFPPLWLDLAEQRARDLAGHARKARSIGIDPAEGGDQTAMAAVDEWGLIDLVSEQTPDTSVIPRRAREFMGDHGVDAHNVVFDRGGGGKQHADLLRSQGLRVRSIGFGETVTLEPRAGRRTMSDRREVREDKVAYENRRVQMYHELSMLMDPGMVGMQVEGIVCNGFAIPEGIMGNRSKATTELRHQLSPLPKLISPQEKYYLPPKNRPKNVKEGEQTKVASIVELIGHSPDEADALVLACHGMLHKQFVATAGAVS